MKEIFRIMLMRNFPKLWLYRSLLSGNESYLRVTGWKESCSRGIPCRADGTVVPWMNYSVISFLEKRLNKDLSLFEYGSGYSTHFFSRLVGNVTSVEYDRTWYERISKDVAENVKLMFVRNDNDGEYCRAIHRANERYDVVIVDGRDRVNCVKQALTRLTARGVLVLDDSQRERYEEAFDWARQQKFLTLDFEGLKPTGTGLERSTLIYKTDNCLGL